MAKSIKGVKLTWLTIFPMPYWEDLFKEPGCPPLDVLYLRTKQSSHPIAGVPGVGYDWYTYEKKNEAVRFIHMGLKDKNRVWIICGWNVPFFLAVALLASMLNRRIWVFTDCPIPDGRSQRLITKLLRSLVLKWLFKNAEYIIGTGNRAVTALTIMGAPVCKVVNLPYPLNEKRFSVRSSLLSAELKFPHYEKQSVSIVVCGRIHLSDKRFDVALKAFASAISRASDPSQIQLRIIGSGPDQHILDELIRELRLTEHITCLGWLNQEKMRLEYLSADICLHCADFEPYGITVVEALYCGVYTVASSGVGAAIELISSSDNGAIFEVGHFNEAGDLLLDAFSRIRSGQISRDKVRQASLKWRMERYIALLTKLTESNDVCAAVPL